MSGRGAVVGAGAHRAAEVGAPEEREQPGGDGQRGPPDDELLVGDVHAAGRDPAGDERVGADHGGGAERLGELEQHQVDPDGHDQRVERVALQRAQHDPLGEEAEHPGAEADHEHEQERRVDAPEVSIFHERTAPRM